MASNGPKAGVSVVGGTQAQPGVLSSIVFVTSQTSADSAMACGGTVIAPTVVLTAAHCVVDARTGSPRPARGIAVTSGRLVTAQAGSGQDLGATRVLVDPLFDPATIRNDAALIFLTAPAAVAPMPLLSAGEAALAAPGTRVAFAGWGATIGSSDQPSPQLLSTTTTLLEDTACGRLLGDDFDPAVTLCAVDAGSFASSTCHGDSGGPLLLRRADGSWVQAGITSWGSLGCDPRVPQAFTRVSAVGGWIAEGVAAAPAIPPTVSSAATPARDTVVAGGGAVGGRGSSVAIAAARYRGSTRQHRAIALRVAAGGRRVAAVEFGYRARCGRSWRAGTFRSAAGTRLPIATRSSGGAFTTLRADGHGRQVRVRGAFTRRGRLSGTVRVNWRERGGVRCDSGVVKYSARR
ncbi:trypsin-like serine protease [Conexibacter sp. CPCC 206217]|uniref:S1 family peptidase n=1 Tax=Conexibacter sp. CPCC 206217 TaxID=3064574 RepID=UPI0027259F4A|nr:serine protease [Conexibacter sp. CPCC 206217]MDO8210906.1 serine protease [Conexibacter sp. CPCC 206217]